MRRKAKGSLVFPLSLRLASGGALLGGLAVAGAPPPTALPVPCIGTSCGAKGATQFVTAGAVTAVAGKNSLTVTQTTGSAILNWSSFNIGAGGTVTFKQPTSSSIALNQIFQASPSQIFGQLNANGQVYLINLNGFLFGPTATVNVGSLLVSSLPLSLTASTFGNGILSPLQNDKPVFDATLDPLAPGVGRTSVLDANGNPVLDANGQPIPVQVVVAPGAQLTAADQGRILLTGQSVTNGGTLTAPDGQVILAAGTQIFLQADSDPNLRGLIVEVDGTASNSAVNQLTGLLSAPRGNITMVGLAVNQDGRISATTSVAANGSIRLEAAGGATVSGTLGDQTVASTIGGALTIGPQSQMQILPDTSGGTAVADQTQYASSVTLLGEQVILQGGSITAPSGTLTAIAAADPSQAAVVASATTAPYTVTGVSNIPDPNARLRVDAGTAIDLSGSSQSLPVTANLVSAQLRSSELADDPTQRNGPLHGLTVYINARDGSPPIADLSGELAAVPETIQQRTEDGGHAIFQSQGDLVFAPGASINVSGGATSYAGGILQTSYLVGANGQLYPIETANPLLDYVGVLNPTFTQTYNSWGVQDVIPTPGLSSYQPGYTQGAPAGSVQFAAPTMVLQGSLQGSVTNGLYQRTPATAAAGGELIIGIPGGVTGATGALDYLAPAVSLTTNPTPIVVADDAPLPGPLTLQLPLSYVTSSGFTKTLILSDADVMLPANTPLLLPNGSTFAVSAARVDVLSSITDPGGTLEFNNVLNVGSAGESAERPGVYVGDGVTLNVAGLWTNDELSANTGAVPTTQTWQNGGTIALGVASPGSLLSIGNDVALHASGGAWLESNGSTVAGNGGSIGLNSAAPNAGLAVGSDLVIDGFGVDGAAGGSLSLTAPRIAIGSSTSAGWTGAQDVDDSVTPGGVFDIGATLFSNYGFQNISLTAVGVVAPGAATSNVITVDAGTNINAVASTLLLSQRAPLLASSDTMAGVATVVTEAPYLRSPMGISLTAVPLSASNTPEAVGATAAGDVAVEAGASITTDPLGSIRLTSLGSIAIDGTLRAPGGNVDLHVETPSVNAFDSGFVPGQGILLSPTAAIDVSGTLVSKPSSAGLSLGTVSAGGTVSLLADRGTVVTDPGSLIAINGVSATLDIAQPNGTYSSEIAASAGGSLTVHSGESISLLGTLEAQAGAGGTSGVAQAGSLEVDLTRSESWWSVNSTAANASFNQNPLIVEIEPTVPPTVPPSAADSNSSALGAAQLAQSGIDALRIEAGNTVELSGDFSLSLGRQLIIDSPVIAANVGAQASLAAPYLELGYELQSSGGTPTNTNTAQLGSGVLSFSGNTIDLLGSTVFQGASSVRFSSTGDLQLFGTSTGTGTDVSIVGALTVAGNLTLDAERIYPATATSFTIDAVQDPMTGTPGTVTIGQTGADPGTPLSAGGALAISAYTITSTGTVYAPFGTITLNATDGITLGDGSLTSVSGGGLTIPYGATQYNGEQWTYDFGLGPQAITGVPARTVTLTAPSVTLAKQATIDLTGGGDLLAYEWVPGPGGTTDALAPASTGVAAVTPGLYAVLPSTFGQSAPQDPALSDLNILPGESVYLSGGGGLPAGTYPLLPARYALLPGAYLIQVEPTYQSTSGGSLGTLANGTPVVAGFLTYGSTGLHQSPGYEGFAVYAGSYAQQLASYDLSLASTFFAAPAGEPQPSLPADAGSLSIAVTNSLDVAGLVRTSAATGGLAAAIDISAADLVVGTPTGPVPADAVSISGAVLGSWQPGSLVLGGVVTADTSGTAGTTASSAIDVLANTITIGSGTTLTAGQIVLVANQSIDVEAGASLESTSGAVGTALKTLPTVQTVTLSGSNPNPGLLAVSDLNWLIPERNGGSAAAGAGVVTIDTGATLASRGSLTVDGTGGLLINGTVTGPGAEWSLGSSSIAFVPAGTQADALSIDPALVAQLGKASAVRLASTGSIDLLTAVSLGAPTSSGPTLDALTLQASSLNNLTGAGTSAAPTAIEFAAKSLTLEGSGALAAAGVAGPTGATLAFVADQLNLGPDAVAELGSSNVLAVNGFAATTATVSGPVIGQGTGGLNVSGNLTIASSGITAATAANTGITASGTLDITAATGKNSAASALGGALMLSGATLSLSGDIAAASGSVTLRSTGDTTILAGASVTAAGSVVDIENQSSAAPGGTITISAGGNFTLSPGATLDVSGAGSAAAGTMAINAGGAATIVGTLDGNGGTGASGGSFAMNAGSLGPAGSTANELTPLAASLTSGGFTNAINLRVQSGNLDLAAGTSLSANSVSLTADSGAVSIGGLISAPSGALRGNLSIFGGAGVELEPGAVLSANGSGANGLGGTIEIGAGQLVVDQTGTLDAYNNASITFDAGSSISAAGAGGMGTLLVRSPAVVAANPALNDVAITLGSGATLAEITSPGNTPAVGQIIIEPVLPFNTATLSSATAPTLADFQNVGGTVGTYMATAAPNISARLASGGAPVVVEAGIEIVASGNLVLPALDLSAAGLDWNFNGEPVDLTVRAAGNLEVSGTLSDGFGSTRVGTLLQPTLLSGPSASLRLVAGADLMSANPLATTVGGTGSLTLDADTVVRTGTGDIDLVAADDILLSGAGSGAYTAGTPAVSPGGSTANAYPGIASNLGRELTVNGVTVGLEVPNTNLLMSFPTGGGNVTVVAGGDIDNTSTSAAGAVTAWQLREGGSSGTSADTPTWGVNLAAYNWNFGTLGGGDLAITAGGSTQNVSAAVTDSLLPQPAAATLQYVKSGGLSFTADGNIGSAQVFVADGTGTVSAGGALTATLPGTSDQNVGSAFYLQSSVIDVTARLGAAVDGVFDPTAFIQSPGGTSGLPKSLAGSFYSYGADSAINIETMTGDIDLGSSDTAIGTLLGSAIYRANVTSDTTGTLPASLGLEALSGNIVFGPGFGLGGTATLYPSPQGQLSLLAAQNIQGNGNTLIMSDAVAGSYATAATPLALTSVQSEPFDGAIHVSDPNPALVTAGGDIEELSLSIPKAATVVAGNDIVDLTFQGQNLNAADITLLSAGQDFEYLNTYTGTGTSVGGPGQLDILAGRNILLGFSPGVVTTGDLLNANLPTAQGATITMVTGLGTAPDISGDASTPGDTGFLGKIVAASSTYEGQLVSYVESLQGTSGLTFKQAETDFDALPLAEQLPLIDSVFFNELSLSGLAETTVPGAGFTEGYAAINALFPGSGAGTSTAVAGAYAGDLTLQYSEIYTLSGGDINLVVPGGEIDVGLAVPPATQTAKAPSQLGIVTEGSGNIDIYSQGDVNVNSSRIFTLGGGNILIWSDLGSIDAGLGAKTSVSAPPPSILINSNGTVTLDFSGAATGSGIRTIQTEPTTPPGDVDLIAPVGTVNAGDAGIGSAGNINIAARSVLGVSNINFGGTATGVPATVSSVSASLSGAANAASGTSNAATSSVASDAAAKEQAAPLAQNALSWLDVFITGLGEENCKQDDIECLKRQKKPTP